MAVKGRSVFSADYVKTKFMTDVSMVRSSGCGCVGGVCEMVWAGTFHPKTATVWLTQLRAAFVDDATHTCS